MYHKVISFDANVFLLAGAKTPSRPAGKTAPPPKAGAQKNAAPAKPKPPSKETLAAVVIQKWVRRFLGRCRLLRLRQEKEEYEALMEKLEKEVGGGNTGAAPDFTKLGITLHSA